MKRFIVVGLGNFGSIVAARLQALGQEVIAIDPQADRIDAIGAKVSRAVVANATSRTVLEQVGAAQADAAIISTGTDLAASILTLMALKDLGVKSIFVKVRSAEHARIVDALGADESVFPERETAMALASRVTAGSLLQYVQLSPSLAIQEMPVPADWYGKTLRELALPQKHQAQVVAIHDMLRDEMISIPGPDRALMQSDSLLVSGHPDALARLAGQR